MNLENANPALFAAIAAAQAEVENATKGSVNDHFKNRYADLAEVLNTVRPVFAKNGLGIIQSTACDGSTVAVTTVLTHRDGGFISSVASCVPKTIDAQGVGSATTYLRRYSLAAICGVAQEDDDGNSASHQQKPAVRQVASPSKVSAEDLEQLRERMGTLSVDEAGFLKHLGIKSLADLDQERLRKAHASLDKKARKLTDSVASTVATQEAA